MYHEFVAALRGLAPTTDASVASFLQYLKIIRVPKGKLLLAEGDICDRLWFIRNGLVRGFYMTESSHGRFEDFTAWFAKENEFFHSPESFLTQAPSSECIEILEDATLIYIRREDLYQLYDEFPEVCCIGRIIAERSLLAQARLLRDMRLLSAPQKLEAFRMRAGNLFARVPQKYIATYLGISENYVSKLKAKY